MRNAPAETSITRHRCATLRQRSVAYATCPLPRQLRPLALSASVASATSYISRNVGAPTPPRSSQETNGAPGRQRRCVGRASRPLIKARGPIKAIAQHLRYGSRAPVAPDRETPWPGRKTARVQGHNYRRRPPPILSARRERKNGSACGDLNSA